MHEQTRPDRDEYVIVKWENIIPDTFNQFDKMSNLTWNGYGEDYDVKSLMHYDGRAFVTQEAYDSGKFSMIEKETGEGLVVNAPRLSSVLGSRKTNYDTFKKLLFPPLGIK